MFAKSVFCVSVIHSLADCSQDRIGPKPGTRNRYQRHQEGDTLLGRHPQVSNNFQRDPKAQCRLQQPDHWLPPVPRPSQLRRRRVWHQYFPLQCHPSLLFTLSVQNKLSDGKIPLGGDDFPNFLWKNEQMNEDDMFDGFMKGDLLLKVRSTILLLPPYTFDICEQGVLHILIAPTAAIEGSGVSKRNGNAAKHGITKITVHLLAYVAVIVSITTTISPSFAILMLSNRCDSFCRVRVHSARGALRENFRIATSTRLSSE